MADTRERRQRRPKRPAVYLILAGACAVVALGSAFEAARPAGGTGAVWQGKARDAGPAAP